MSDESIKSLTISQRKLVDYSVAIFGEPATSKESAYMARQLVQLTLPHKNPGDVPEWIRRNGNLTLSIKPGYRDDQNNKNRRICIGYPYGTIPRLLLFWMISEAIRTKSPNLELGKSLNGFMQEIGLNRETGGGKRSDAKRLREQMDRLFNAFISFEGDIGQGGKMGEARLNMAVASKIMLWWNFNEPTQNAFDSHIELNKDFYEAIISAPVPVDMRALKALKQSPLALDLYAWLTYEAYRANKSGESRFETWEQLHSHLGGDYTHIQHFRAKVKAALAKIKVVYPGLKLGNRQGGIEVLPESLPALQPRCTTIKITTTPAPAQELPSPTMRPLKPSTIERFKATWRRLDPYACQADFEAWLGEQSAKREPKNYDSAFMGFAKKWATGKL